MTAAPYRLARAARAAFLVPTATSRFTGCRVTSELTTALSAALPSTNFRRVTTVFSPFCPAFRSAVLPAASEASFTVTVEYGTGCTDFTSWYSTRETEIFIPSRTAVLPSGLTMSSESTFTPAPFRASATVPP